MRWEKIAESWPQFVSLVNRHWTELSSDQVVLIDGQRELLADSLQECYGLSRDVAEREIEEWITTFGDIDDDDDESSNIDMAELSSGPRESARSRSMGAAMAARRFQV